MIGKRVGARAGWEYPFALRAFVSVKQMEVNYVRIGGQIGKYPWEILPERMDLNIVQYKESSDTA